VVEFEPKLFETRRFETELLDPKLLDPKLLKPKPSEQPSSPMPNGRLWRLHPSVGDIGSCLSDRGVPRRQSAGRNRARVLGQRRRARPRRAARILFKEMMKQHGGEQCDAGKSGASKHSARPGVDIGLFGLGQPNMKMWSHDQFFLCDHQIGQSLSGGDRGLREEDSIGRQKFPFSRAKMKLAGGNNSARAEVMDMSCAVNPQDPAA
jgi:hypothetical protein